MGVDGTEHGHTCDDARLTHLIPVSLLDNFVVRLWRPTTSEDAGHLTSRRCGEGSGPLGGTMSSCPGEESGLRRENDALLCGGSV